MVFLESSGFTKSNFFFLFTLYILEAACFLFNKSYSWLLQATGCIPESSQDLSNTSELPIIIPLTHEL